MSQWTHITATLSVDTAIYGVSKSELRRRVRSILNRAPDIAGSEGKADINVFVKSGHNQSACVGGEWTYSQSCIIISIQGDLRDMDKEEVKKELTDFANYIEEQFWIRDGSYGLVDNWVGSETGLIKDLLKDLSIEEEGEEQ